MLLAESFWRNVLNYVLKRDDKFQMPESVPDLPFLVAKIKATVGRHCRIHSAGSILSNFLPALCDLGLLGGILNFPEFH